MRTQNDEFYPTVFEKAAYLFCGLIEGHYFSNGNKRLALMSTVFFLGLNNYNTRNVSRNAGITLLKKSFPNAILSQVSDIPEVVPELSYHLCKIVADSPTHQMDFDTLKRTVERILQFLFIEK
jgi:death-on-curing family protein